MFLIVVYYIFLQKESKNIYSELYTWNKRKGGASERKYENNETYELHNWTLQITVNNCNEIYLTC